MSKEDIPPDTSEILDLECGYRVKVERTRPENSPEHLAMLLVEALDAERVHMMEEQSYKTNALAEGQKVQQLREVISELKRREKDPPKKISRMDPYATYDIDLCKEELKQAQDRMQEFNHTAASHTEGIKAARIKQREVRQKLNEIRNRGNQR